MKGLIIAVMLGAIVLALHGQDAAPPSVDLFSGQKQPERTPTISPEPPPPPNVPELSQLDESFKQRSLGQVADERRLHLELRQLKNRVANDPSVRAAEAATHTATTDLEKRQRLRDYYNIYYKRMSALVPSGEIRLALVPYIGAKKGDHLGALAQPRVRPSPGASPPAPAPSPTPAHKHKKHQQP